MISKELYKCAFKYYTFHKELNINIRITNIGIIFGISKASFYRSLKKNNENITKKNNKEK